LEESFQPSRDAINAFARGNVIFNSWPYFREYVQSTVSRMDYPPPTIPFLRLTRRPEKLKELVSKKPNAGKVARVRSSPTSAKTKT